jgi:sugar phosphate isomerase/epimerase
MKFRSARAWLAAVAAACAFSMAGLLTLVVARAESLKFTEPQSVHNLWEHSNLFAWIVLHTDTRERGPEERAQMLKDLGFTKFAYNWRESDVPDFDREIEALQKHGIEITAWALYGSEHPHTQLILDTFKRHGIHPQFWLSEALPGVPQSTEEWAKVLPAGVTLPKTSEDEARLSEKDKEAIEKALVQLLANDIQTTPQQQLQRVNEEADRVAALARRAAPYGVKIELYNHNGWLGMEENQLAVIARLQQLGVTDVGMVYNFNHARDEVHDDSTAFPALWRKMQAHAVAVNISGMHWEGKHVFPLLDAVHHFVDERVPREFILFPSQGDSELDMMRVIQKSGWRGPIGLIAEKGGDAEVTLKNYLVGLDWLAAELKQPGSAGPRPFPPIP